MLFVAEECGANAVAARAKVVTADDSMLRLLKRLLSTRRLPLPMALAGICSFPESPPASSTT
jgi:hypothetical protein